MKIQENSKTITTTHRRLHLATALLLASVVTSPALKAEWVEHEGKRLNIALPGETIPNQVVVIASTSNAQKALPALARQMGASVKRNYPEARMQVWQTKDDQQTKAVLKALGKNKELRAFQDIPVSITPPPGVVRQLKKDLDPLKTPKAVAESPDGAQKLDTEKGEVGPAWTTNDVAAPFQWALWKVRDALAPTPSTAVKGIAIIDTGVDYTHPDLSGKVVNGWDYVDWDGDAMDAHGHGTHCAGIAAAKANNTVGTRGISPNSKIYAYRVLDEYGYGYFSDILAAIRKAADNAAVHVLSLSLGGYAQDGSTEYNEIKAAVDYAVNTKKKLVVVAAGNEENDYLYYYAYTGSNYRPVPAWVPNSFTVAASNESDRRAYFSNYDVSSLTSGDGEFTYSWNFVDIAAPGTNILSTTMGGGYESWGGTSMATPLVAGAAARVWDKNPTWTPTQVRDRLISTGKSLGAAQGFQTAEKRLDVLKALGGTTSGGFQGTVLNGETGRPQSGVKVEAIAAGVVKKTTTTNAGGIYLLDGLAPLASGSYTLKMTRGPIVRSVNAGNTTAGNVTDRPHEVMAPSRATTTADENWRIIAYWPDTNPGYDYWIDGYFWGGFDDYFPYTSYHAPGLEANAYLMTPSGYYPIYYGNPGSLSGAPYVRYTHDSWTTGAPVEAHVIRDQESGTYKYWLRVDPYDWGWGSIKYGSCVSPKPCTYTYPVVLVYKGNTLMKTITASSATRVGTGTKYWNVLTLNGNTVTTINQITDTQP